MNFPLFVGVLCLSLFCYALLCVLSSFATILKRNGKLVALLLLSYRCILTKHVLWLFLAVPWVGLQCVIVVFPDHTHLLFRGKAAVAIVNKGICDRHITFTGDVSIAKYFTKSDESELNAQEIENTR